MNESPVFIVGVPRSGTTLLRLVINRHPRIAIPDETGYFRDVYERYSAHTEQWRGSGRVLHELVRGRITSAH